MRDDEQPFVLLQWKLVASNFSITAKTNGKKLAGALRKVATTADDAVREQIMERQRALSAMEHEIAGAEAAKNARVYQLYDLIQDEIRLVEAG